MKATAGASAVGAILDGEIEPEHGVVRDITHMGAEMSACHTMDELSEDDRDDEPEPVR